MEYARLGTSGAVVSKFALGTMTFGSETDEKGSHDQLDRFFESGGTLVDTADVYSAGLSEEIIGRWLKGASSEAKDRIFLATKGRFATSGEVNGLGLSRRHLDKALNASLNRLQVDTVDLYQLHAWDAMTPVEETLRFLSDAVEAGKIRYIGLSNYLGWQIQKFVDAAHQLGLPGPVALQPAYSLLVREIEYEIVPACLDNGLGILPWSPLGGGWLTGKYHRNERPSGDTRLGKNPDRGVEAYDRRAGLDRTWRVLEELEQIANKRGVSMAQVALAWLVDRDGVSSVILGARTLDQLSDNLGASGLHLDFEETSCLDAASYPNPGDYPYGEMGIAQRARDLPH